MMKNKLLFIFLITIIVFQSVLPDSAQSGEKKALLIIAHGSHSPAWNAFVLKLEQKVIKQLSLSDNPFFAVRVALMEMSEPSVATVIKELEKQGIEQVYALPMFIAPSGHSVYDIPAILGLYSEKSLLQTLEEEKIEIVRTKMKIVLGPTLNHSSLLEEIILDRVKELSTDPGQEGVVLLAHGCPEFEPVWHEISQNIGSYICAKTGITKFDYAFVEVGQSFETSGLPYILKMSGECKKTIVAGLYLSLAPKIIAGWYLKEESLAEDWFTEQNIYFSDKALLPDDRLTKWIVGSALEWTKSNMLTRLKPEKGK